MILFIKHQPSFKHCRNYPIDYPIYTLHSYFTLFFQKKKLNNDLPQVRELLSGQADVHDRISGPPVTGLLSVLTASLTTKTAKMRRWVKQLNTEESINVRAGVRCKRISRFVSTPSLPFN